MKKLWAVLSYVLLLLVISPIVLAQCSVNGKEVPCNQLWTSFGWIFIVIGIVSIVAFIFWTWMLIDCIKRDFKDKTLWIIIIIFANILGVILYYFIVKRKK